MKDPKGPKQALNELFNLSRNVQLKAEEHEYLLKCYQCIWDVLEQDEKKKVDSLSDYKKSEMA